MTDASSGNANAANNHRVIVSLAFIPSSTAAPSLTSSLTSDFNAHLPLTDLQWKSSSRGTQRTIERLSLDFRPFASLLADEATPKAQIPISLLSKPYLHILFIACDDNEVYRTTVRPDIRQWMDAVNRKAGANKTSIEWLMVHVTTQKSGPKKFYQTKGSVFDKIRADFNHTKRDRVVQLPRPQSPNEAAILKSDVQKNTDEDQALWKEFLVKVKESIVSAFDTNFTSYEEDVRKVDAQRQMPGWNFCTFFIQKEGLAHSFEAMNLLEDALVQYDELEASYTLSARTSSLTWFKSLGGTSPGDECLSIFDANSKPFRKLIVQNEITIFDFRIYLFGRQAALVCALGQITELARRATPFIHSMAKMLRARDGALKPHFAEIWIYSACLDVIQKCQKMCTTRKLNPAAQPDLLPLLAGLYEVAVRQLEKLGMHYGYLPRKHPFLMSANVIKDIPETDEENCDGNEGKRAIECAREDLQLALKDQIGYDMKYRELLERTLEAWNGSLRLRNAAKVRATIAAFEQCRQRNSQAEDIYSTLHSNYSSSHWTAIESQLLVQSIHLQDSLSRPRDRLLSTLALVRTGLEAGSLTWTLGRAFFGHGELRSESVIARDLMGTVRDLSATLEKDFAVMAFPVFETDIEEIHAGTLEEEEGVSVLVKILNHLPTELDIDEVRLKLVNTAGEPLWLSSASSTKISLKPGKNVVQTASLASVTGTYALDISQLRLSRTVFQYSHRTSLQRNLPFNKDVLIATKQPIVVFGHDRRAVELDLEESGETYLDRPRDIILVISPGRSHLSKLTLHLQEPPGKISFLLSSVQALSTGSCILKVVDGALEISEIELSEPIRLRLPFEIFTQEAYATVPVQLEYTTKNRPDYKRQLRSTLRIKLALPLSVNVQDFLRDDFILSRFTVSADSAIPLRIQNAELQESAGLKAVSARRKRNESLTIHRTLPATFIFRISKDGTSSSANISESRLRMNIKYRSYEHELQHLLRNHILAIFEKHDQTVSKRMSKAIIAGIIASHPSLATLDLINAEQPNLGTFEEAIWKDRLAVYWRSSAEWDALRGCLVEIYETPVSTAPLGELPWHLLSIPFEVPSVAIYNRVSLELPSPLSFPLQVGNFIDVKIHITTSFRWANPAEQRDMQSLASGQRMLYDISTRSNDWLINGRAKGEFYATEGSNNTIALSLSPIRPGKLFVPSITVYPLPQPGQPVPTAVGVYNTLPSCETFQENAATSVLVVQQDYGRSQVWIDRAEGVVAV